MFSAQDGKICRQRNDKGKVEELIGFVRHDFFAPIRRAEKFEKESGWIVRESDVKLREVL
jgi:transposase